MKMCILYYLNVTLNNQHQLTQKTAMDTYTLGASRLDGTLIFANGGFIIPLPPYKEAILDSALLAHLKLLYHFLYPNLNFLDILPFYNCYGHVTLAGDLIGSIYPGANNHAFIFSCHG